MDTEALLGAAEELIAIPSTALRPDKLERALAYVLDFVGDGFAVEYFESGGKPSALVHPEGTGPDYAVIFNAHLDVVDAAGAQFVPRRVDNRLYGRGAHDMKVSALVEALVFREAARNLEVPVALQLVTDEEVGGAHGTEYQLERGVSAGFVVIGEQTELKVVTASRGLLAARLRAAGHTAHGAYPWLGDNALLKITTSVDALLARYPVPTKEAWRTTVNLARIATDNEAFNTVPERAEAWLDIRYPPGDEDFDNRPAREVVAYLESFCAPGVWVEIDHASPPHHVDPASPYVAALQAASRHAGYTGDLLRKHGSGDGRYYSARGMQAVAFGVGGAGQHGPDEYADIATIEPYHAALHEFLATVTAIDAIDPAP